MSFEETQKKAEQGNADAQSILGYCYRDGIGTAKDESKAFEWFKKSAEQGNAYAQSNLGYCYQNGIGTAKDESKAFEWFKKSAEQGDAGAQSNLGDCYEKGIGTAKDDVKAFEWYRKSAEQGNFKAQVSLGFYYKNGIGTAKDEPKAFEWFKKAAEQGNSDAQNILGICYQDGIGTAKDDTKAFEWFKKAAEQGDAGAQYKLGLCYGKGSGVAQDRVKSFEWFKKAAEQKDDIDTAYIASIQIACYYLGGSGIEPDTEKAMSYLDMAADNGSDLAQFLGAFTYMNGYCFLVDICTYSPVVKAVPEDLDKAIKYAKMELDNPSSDCVGKFLCASIAICGHSRKGELKEAYKIAVEHPALSIVGIGLFAILIAAFGLEMAIIFWFYRRSRKVQLDGGLWRLSDFFVLLLVAIPLVIISSIVSFLLPLHVLISGLIMMLILHCICVAFFVVILRKRGATIMEAFALRMIPLKTFFLWMLACGAVIIVFGVAYDWVCSLLGIKLDNQLIVDLFSSKSLFGAELVFACIAISLVLPILEEFIFRGIIYQSLKTKMRPWIAIAISSVIFAAPHMSLSAFIPLFIMGAIFAYSLEKTKSLYVPICLHCVNNAAMVAIMLFYR